MLAHSLTVKLSPCPYSHSSPAVRIAACLCGHPKCNLLLAQARPRMIQHLSSQIPIVVMKGAHVEGVNICGFTTASLLLLLL